jgi:coenzyme F420-reducing hydrogenase beta subunit
LIDSVVISGFCTGCSACYNVCPTGAIFMELDCQGFISPTINKKKCVDCGVCKEYCPISNPVNSEKIFQETCFAAWSKEKETQSLSSSGGIFTEIATSVIEAGGVVFGASFDNTFTLRHDYASTYKDLAPLRGSKYVQSHINDAYNKAVSFGLSDEPVLFMGTPCQIAAMKKVLVKNRDVIKQKIHNFILCDVFCYGVPSEFVFNEYLCYVKNKTNSELKTLNFRDKRINWKSYGLSISFLDGSEKYECYSKNSYLIGYLKNLSLRLSCYDCPFARLPRQSDITIGDFWGVPQHLYNSNGVSAVIVNSKRGKELFNNLTNIHKFQVTVDQITYRNKRLINGHLNIPSERADFFNDLKMNGYEKTAKKYLKQTLRNKILDYFSFNQ